MANYQTNQPFSSVHHKHDRLDCQTIPQAKAKIDDKGQPIAVVEEGKRFLLATNEYGNPQFVSEISRCQPLRLEHMATSWNRDMKYGAQDVLPFLFLGPMSTARNTDFIQRNGITMLLAVRDGRAASINSRIMNPALFESAKGIETLTFDVMNCADLIQRFRIVIRKIHQHLNARTACRPVSHLSDVGGKILVFCEAGDTRSAAVVVLYFMAVFGMTAKGAVQAVHARRYAVNISGEMSKMLQTVQEILQAERDVNTSKFSPLCKSFAAEVFNRAQKRSMDDYKREDEDLEMQLGKEEYRIGVAPFTDIET